MDIFLINHGTWRPYDHPLRNYYSLIWTERFSEDSDFELESYDVAYYEEHLPIGTLVSVRGSVEVMMVEEQYIDVDDADVEIIKIKGKSLTSYLDHRVVGEKRNSKYETAAAYTTTGMALMLLYNSFNNNQGYDYTKAANAYYKKPKDWVQYSVVTNSVTSDTSSAINRMVTPGPLRPMMDALLREGPYGFRMFRPISPQGNVITLNASGTIISTPTTDIRDLRFDIYNGVDRSSSQSTNTPIVLDVEHDDLIQPKYVNTQATYKNEAHIMTDTKSVFAYTDQFSDSQNFAGFYRRVRFVDPGQPEEGVTATNFENYSIRAAENLLRIENYKKNLIDGAVSTQAKKKFGVDYFLGDILTVRGRYGLTINARVTEYIRAESETGESGYPTLEYLS